MQITPYTPTHLHQAAQIWLAAGRDEYHYLPQFLALTRSGALQVFAEHIVSPNSLWLAELAGEAVGFMALNPTDTRAYIDRLYVLPSAQRCGVGATLLDFAKTRYPQGLDLHTHQQNFRARSFYEKHQFIAVKFGISPAPECVPDVAYHWPAE